MSSLARPAPVDLAVDSSALLAILLDEPGRSAIEGALASAGGAVMTASNLLEASMVALGRVGTDAIDALDDVVIASGIVCMPVDQPLIRLARTAFERFGKGRHPAALNFGDCFSYALARHFDVPLLCTGDDFARTDLVVLPG